MIRVIRVDGKETTVNCQTGEGLSDHMTWMEFGRWCSERWVSPFMVDGYVATNLQMAAVCCHAGYERRQKIERDGCCRPEGPMETGHCPGGGMCAAYIRAEQITYHYFGKERTTWRQD